MVSQMQRCVKEGGDQLYGVCDGWVVVFMLPAAPWGGVGEALALLSWLQACSTIT